MLLTIVKNKMGSAPKLIISLIIPQLAGGIGSLFTMNSVGTWYQILEKPFFSPPNWVFAPVWTTLFILMGVALFLVWKKDYVPGRNLALWVFGIQLALNVLWSFVFFGMHQPGWAMAEILVLWFAIAANMLAFHHVSKAAGWLLLPYLLWVSFAAVLNCAIWRLN